MASDKHQPTLANVPLEVRHLIFEYVAARDVQPKKLLRYWFEKKEVKEKTAEMTAKNASMGQPRVVYAGDQFGDEEDEMGDSEDGEEGDSDGDGDGWSDEDGDGWSDEDSDEEEDEGGSDDDGVLAAAAALISQPAGPSNAALAAQVTASNSVGQVLAGANQALAAANAAFQSAMATVAALHTPTAPALPLATPAQVQGQAGDEDEDSDADMSEDGDEEDAEMDAEDDDEDVNEYVDSDEEMAEGDDDADSGAGVVQPAPLPAPVITAHGKWRHIPKFMRITHCPPPVELLLTSRQLNAEAKSWFYDVVALRIDATGSFAHTSFFEEAFSQITEAAFSPMEDIRKVEVTFVWDTTWLRSEEADCAAAIFPALLRQRAHFVTSILAKAPCLGEVTIHWHDSANDEEAVDLMNDVLLGFLSLNADVKVEPHYIAAEAKPYRKSVAGQQRVEFKRIIDNGLDRLF